MNNNPIGILDSGIGGLSVWREVARLLPQESIIYIADSQNMPYGAKSREEIYTLAKRLINFLKAKQVKLIIMACNTITVTCLEQLRNDYPDLPLIGTVPVIKTAASVTKNNKIGVFSTSRTAASQYQKDLIEKFASHCEVTTVGTDELAPLIEEGVLDGEKVEKVLQEVLTPFIKNNVDTVALACTHYPFVSEVVQRILGPDVSLLEPSGAIARHTKRVLESNNALAGKGEVHYEFYTTGDAEKFSTVAKKLLAGTIQAEHVNV